MHMLYRMNGVMVLIFGISLSLWDYIFKTNYIPEASGKLTLGYSGDTKMPKRFFAQLFYGFRRND